LTSTWNANKRTVFCGWIPEHANCQRSNSQLIRPAKSAIFWAAPQGVSDQIFENLADSNQHPREAGIGFATSQVAGESGRKKGFDKAVIRLLNGTLTFVFNRSAYPRVGFATLCLTLRKTKIATGLKRAKVKSKYAKAKSKTA
jgi:hypothetical protein